MNNLRCVIVEDEIHIAEELIFLLSKYDFIKIKARASNGEEGLKIIKEVKPDIVFLDINMPGMNGLDLANIIRKNNIETVIIFVTAYENYALKAFEIEALDYVLKPFDEDRLENTIKRIKTHFKLNGKKDNNIDDKIQEILEKLGKEEKRLKKLPCEHYGKIIFVRIDDICFCYTENDKTYVKSKDKEYVTIYNLSEIEEKTKLIRVHRSFVINKDNIKEFYALFNYSYKVVMNDSNNTEIPVSRNKIKELKTILGL
ncbi:MAG: two component transcriptional regulator, LytTR family [Clostridiaceae bacterium]|nr:two component transcriptional regulator, LytTR family [Clostridiaceae bacterium]